MCVPPVGWCWTATRTRPAILAGSGRPVVEPWRSLRCCSENLPALAGESVNLVEVPRSETVEESGWYEVVPEALRGGAPWSKMYLRDGCWVGAHVSRAAAEADWAKGVR